MRLTAVHVANAQKTETGGSILLRVVCFLCCIPSGGALLAKVYGVAGMQAVTLALALPCCCVLWAVWVWASRSNRSNRQQLALALRIGFLGGLFGTIAYDIVRIPFTLSGQRIFAPISSYGVWIADAQLSSPFTETIGWAYHLSNGITFAIMYALFMQNRHWLWAILWAFVLETIAITSPFARIFSLSGNYTAIGIAYLGHVGYGLPLGRLVHNWSGTNEWIVKSGSSLNRKIVLLTCAAVFWPLAVPGNFERSAVARSGEFRVEGRRLNPDWLRIERGRAIRVYNPGPQNASVVIKQNNVEANLLNGESETFSFEKPGIYQTFVKTDGQTWSSFVIVEPVEEFQ